MKHLLTISALLVSSLAMGQMPYNPDSNGDDLIGAPDLLSFLGLYNTLMVDSSLTCDYEGTELESLIGGLFSGDLIMDSVYVEYTLIDSSETYLPGCPDPVVIDMVLDRSYMLTNPNLSQAGNTFYFEMEENYLGYWRKFQLNFYSEYGTYLMELKDYEVAALSTNYDAGSVWYEDGNVYATVPFSQSWTLTEDGFSISWSPYNWVSHTEHFRLIPFWSEAE